MRCGHGFDALTFPIGCPQIIFHKRSPLFVSELDVMQDSRTVSGQVTFPARLQAHGDVEMIVAVFHPHALPAVMGIPASEFYDCEVPVSLVGDRGFDDLSRRVQETADDAVCVAMIERWLLSRIAGYNRRIDFMRCGEAVRLMMTTVSMPMAALASEVGLSRKQFERVFRSTVGMGAKEYARVVRFQKSLWHMQCGERNFADVAYACGYADQSHFIRECREFSGLTPARLCAEQPLYSDLFSSPFLSSSPFSDA